MLCYGGTEYEVRGLWWRFIWLFVPQEACCGGACCGGAYSGGVLWQRVVVACCGGVLCGVLGVYSWPWGGVCSCVREEWGPSRACVCTAFLPP